MCTINELILIIKEYNRLTNPKYVYKSDNAIELGTFLKSSNTKSKYILCMQDAKSGNSLGMNDVGFILESHNKYDEARKWYRKSSNLNDIIGMYNLSKILLIDGSHYDKKESVKLLVKSINLGSILSVRNICASENNIYYKELFNIEINKHNAENKKSLLKMMIMTLQKVIERKNINVKEILYILENYSKYQREFDTKDLRIPKEHKIKIKKIYLNVMPITIPLELNNLIIDYIIL